MKKNKEWNYRHNRFYTHIAIIAPSLNEHIRWDESTFCEKRTLRLLTAITLFLCSGYYYC